MNNRHGDNRHTLACTPSSCDITMDEMRAMRAKHSDFNLRTSLISNNMLVLPDEDSKRNALDELISRVRQQEWESSRALIETLRDALRPFARAAGSGLPADAIFFARSDCTILFGDVHRAKLLLDEHNLP